MKLNNPERIYLFYDINKYESLLKTLKISDLKNDNDYNYILLEINMNKNMVIHSDPNYTDGFFTYDNISVNDIKILKEYL